MGVESQKQAATVVVDPGGTPKIYATGIAAIDRGNGYVQLTLCFDQLWGGSDVKEREIQGRVVFTLAAWAELCTAVLGGPRPDRIEEIVLRAAH